MPRVLLGVSGTVAAVKTAELTRELVAQGHEVKVAVTESARHFVDATAVRDAGALAYHTDADEYSTWTQMGDAVLHIELRRWADAMLVIASVNTMAKVALGLSDNLVTCTIRAWGNPQRLIVAPAANTLMWEAPVTAEHVATIRRRGSVLVDPVSKRLACGDTGMGALAAVSTLVRAIEDALASQPP